MAEIILPTVVEHLATLIEQGIGSLLGVHKEMEKLKSTFSTIQAVLEDAERKQHLQEHKDSTIKDWLRKLKYASYEVDDILSDCAAEAIRFESRSGKKVCLPSLTCYPVVGNIVFRYKIGNRMREVGERLKQIANERNDFHLDHIPEEKRVGLSEIRQTGSILTEPQVFGRDEDKEKIVQVLNNHISSGSEDLLVYPVIGMGGLGKTTLAQFVFNDVKVASLFDAKIWVCVSEDFDVKRILKAIIESASGKACEVSDLNPLQRHLQDILNGKRYLLVLDDVWNDNQDKWEWLKCILNECGSRGASIITTTRLEKVATIMGTIHPHRLIGLSDDDCWLLFKQRAFGSEREEHPNLEAIGKEIVKKFGGVPLAAKALGSLMRFKRKENDWVFVKDNEIWNLPQDETSILPALRLSYYNLPLELRRCFAYCAVYEKDTVIEKDDLIHLWMANGFISFTNENKDMEDIGNEIWNELYLRSFFQNIVMEDEYSNQVKTFKMHDLVHDLAQSIMEEECQILEVIERPTKNMSGKRVRHLNLITQTKLLTTIPKELHIVDSLRTLIYTEKQENHGIFSSEISIFENYGALRAFKATLKYSTNLASSIGSLKHLRYLRLCGRNITTLPDSICNLWYLQTLDLERCGILQRLPEKMRCLRNLRHLLTPYGLSETPPFIGELTCLKKLNGFGVEKRRGCGLDELEFLKLGGYLEIKNLERVGNWMDAKKANLIAKQNLHSLKLSWDSEEHHDSQEEENVEQLLEALQPHPNLQKLEINDFKGTHFPLWMNDYSNLKSIVSLMLSGCINCLQLPPLHQLPSLRFLDINYMKKVEYIMMINEDNNNYQVEGGGNAIRGFQSLETLYLVGLQNLKGLSNEEEGGRGPLFPCLHLLEIMDCPKLTNLPPYGFPALEVLYLKDNRELTSISDCLESLTSLRSLEIYNCPKLTSITANFRNLTKLQKFKSRRCPKLATRYEEGSGADWHMIAHIPRRRFNICDSLKSADDDRISTARSSYSTDM